MEFKFNFNEYVKVKVTPDGEQILKRQHDELNDMITSRGGIGFGDFKLDKDNEGYSKFQFWQLMNYFGQYMSNGCEIPFESDVIIVDGELIDVKTN